MPDYRRNRVAGGCYLFTVNLQDRRSDLLIAEIGALRDAFRETRRTRPFHINACVVLPDHLYCLRTLPPDGSDFPTRWRTIKALFSRHVAHPHNRRPSLHRKREVGVWQRRYGEHTIRDDADYAAPMDYIQFNPVKHGFAERPAAWPHGRSRASTRGLRWASTPRAGRLRTSNWLTPVRERRREVG